MLRLRWWNGGPFGAIWRNLSLPLRFRLGFILWRLVGFWAHIMAVIYATGNVSIVLKSEKNIAAYSGASSTIYSP